MTNKTSIFQRPLWVTIFALTAAIAWGWAYPLIKLGMQEFAITPDMTGSKMLFAGIRFCLSGLIILSRAAILNSLSVFAVVIFACIFFKSDHMTIKKIVGCVVGFAGILSLNIGGAESGSFTWLGDGMIILNALCGASASLMIRGLGKRVDVFVGTGYSLALGGTLLVIPGLLMGATLPNISVLGGLYLLLLIAISTLGFTLYNKLLTCNPVGKVAIYNSLIPVVGAVTSCLCLHETFYIKYVVAGFLAALGIYIINKS